MRIGASGLSGRTGVRRALVPAALVLAWLAPGPGAARAAYYWGAGTLSSTPSVCFVGNAIANEAAWVAQIREGLRQIEAAANIRFQDLGTCPPPVSLPVIGDVYEGDIRIALFPGSGRDWNEAVPGALCTIGFVNSSFGREPEFLDGDRPCLYNLKLGKDADGDGRPWFDHALHELGHSLGLAHEHQRPDALNASCVPKAASCPAAADPPNELVCMTPYDRDSVMNYQDLGCGISGNYGHNGLSTWDRLGLHLLYPQDARIAEATGTKVAPTTGAFRFRSTWAARGALLPAVLSGALDWRVNGAAVGSGASVELSRPLGEHTLTLAYRDFLGRDFSYSTRLRSLSPAEHAGTMAALVTIVPEPAAGLSGGAALLVLAGLARGRRAGERAAGGFRPSPSDATRSALPRRAGDT